MRKLRYALGLLLTAALSFGCATIPRPTDSAAFHADTQVGVASFYGAEYEGGRTSSGARYDPERLTAAHPTLPFGTRARVTNLENGRSVVVTITDRGPFRRGRIIDVSQRAARRLGFLRDGTARVRVQVIAE